MLQWLPHTGGESTPHLVAMQFFLLSQGVKKTLRLIGQEEAVSQNIKPRNKRESATRIMAAAAGNSAVGVASGATPARYVSTLISPVIRSAIASSLLVISFNSSLVT